MSWEQHKESKTEAEVFEEATFESREEAEHCLSASGRKLKIGAIATAFSLPWSFLLCSFKFGLDLGEHIPDFLQQPIYYICLISLVISLVIAVFRLSLLRYALKVALKTMSIGATIGALLPLPLTGIIGGLASVAMLVPVVIFCPSALILIATIGVYKEKKFAELFLDSDD